MLAKIISGGQTGVDRGALDAALEAGFPCGGACPRDRRAEDGRIPVQYPLEELHSRAYRVRTARNVVSSCGTLIIHCGELSGGTLVTLRMAEELGKPVLLINAAETPPHIAKRRVREWLDQHGICVLNVAGPRHSSWHGGSRYAKTLISKILGHPVSGESNAQSH
jgi:hypothetical protein